MKVLLIANYVPDGQNSMLAFRRVLERELPRLGCEVRVISPPGRLLRFFESSRWRKWPAYVDKFVLFMPSLARPARWADVVHVLDHSNSLYVPWVDGRPNVVTCHDVVAVQAAKGMVEGWNVGRFGRLLQRLIMRGLARADLIACVSDLTQRDLKALGFADERRITTVLNGLNDDFSPTPPDEARRLLARFGLATDDRYLIHVGIELDRKNRRGVLEAFIALQERAAAAGTRPVARRLVFVGPELPRELAQLAQGHGVLDRVQTLQQVSHEELRALYSGAVALVFPSLQEGFGWPVIEAQACGCPVFTSDRAPMNEIGGAGAVYVDPLDPPAIAAAIEQATPRLDDMRRLGLENAAHYTAAQMAANYLAAYQRAIDERGARP
jgi:glycosyltransferase involved in cell wall biosynthesis